MKLLLLVVLALASLVSGYTTYMDHTKHMDKDLLVKQKFVLEIFRHVHQPLQLTDYLVDGKTFVEGEMYYTNYEKILKFIDLYHAKMLPRGEVFSIMNKRHLKEVKGLFNLFYFSKDWVTLRKNIIWARIHVNEGMFVYALTACVIHRDDMAGVMLPSPYEINPFKFFDSEKITEGIKYKLQTQYSDDKDATTHIIFKNYTEHHHEYLMNKDSKLAYFTEDIGLNAYYYYFQLDYGFWLGEDKDYGFDLIHRGERYLHVHQQLLTRYYMERLSNGLGEIYEFDWTRPIETGYFSKLRYHNGLVYPMRHNNYVVRTHTKRDILIQKVKDHERRLRDVIDSGYLVIDNKRIDIRNEKSIELLGKMIMGYSHNEDYHFYRYVELFSRILLSGSFYTKDDYKIVPGVLEHFETSLRDPVFYMLYKRIVRFYFDFKDHLKPYTKDDLKYQGIVIDDAHVGKLVTYFEHYDTDISNIIDMKYKDKMDHKYTMNYHKELKDTSTFNWLIKIRQMRLNHEPMIYSLDVTSDKNQKVVVRAFYAPKYDEFGQYITLKENRENMVEFDKFVYEMKIGKNLLKRNSREFFYTIPDGTTYLELYKRVMTSTVDTYFGMDLKDRYCGFPDRLLLPKGKIGGFHMQLYFVITPFTGSTDITPTKVLCGKYNNKFYDELPYGYPFDRKVEYDFTFHVDNIYKKDVLVFHRDQDMNMHYNY